MTVDLNHHTNDYYNLIKDIPYKSSGMFNNEVFIVYALYKELQCDMFIESGISNGVSTERFLKFINDEYIGIDWDPNCYGAKVNLKNFYFTCADSRFLISKLIKHRKNKNIFIMIDGPKGPDAIIMKNQFLENDNVKIVAIHDTYDGLENEDYLRIFETKNNFDYNKKYFDFLNLKNNNNIDTVYNFLNVNGQYFSETFPSGPGISIYSKMEINFKL